MLETLGEENEETVVSDDQEDSLSVRKKWRLSEIREKYSNKTWCDH